MPEQPTTHQAAISLLRDELLPDLLAASITLRNASEFATQSGAEDLAAAWEFMTVGLDAAAEQIRALLDQDRAATEAIMNMNEDGQLERAQSRHWPRRLRKQGAWMRGAALRRRKPSHAMRPIATARVAPARMTPTAPAPLLWWRSAALGSIAAALLLFASIGATRAYERLDHQLASVQAAQRDTAGRLAQLDASARAAAHVPLQSDSTPVPPQPPPPAVVQTPTPVPNNDALYLSQIGSLTYERDDARGQLAIAQQQLSLLRGQLSQVTSELAQQRQAYANQSQRVSALTECLTSTQIAVAFTRSPVPNAAASDTVLASTDACSRR